MLVSTFAPDIAHLGSIWYPANTAHMFSTTYHVPYGRQYIMCQAELLTIT